MKDKILKEFYETLEHISSSNINRYFKNHFQTLYDKLILETAFLDNNASIFERIYCLEHNLKTIPLCKVCHKNKVRNFIVNARKYSDWCSIHCANIDKATIQKSKTTRLEKYGDANFNNNNKAKNTRMQKNGSYHAADFITKIKNTKLNKYGDENFVNVKKLKQTLKENPNININRVKKIKQTKKEKYNDENWNNRAKFKTTFSTFSSDKKQKIIEKRKNTNKTKYGAEHFLQTQTGLDKVKCTCMKKYNVKNPMQNQQVKDKAKQTLRKSLIDKNWITLIYDDGYSIAQFDKKYFLQNGVDTEFEFKCKVCGKTYMAQHKNGRHKHCPQCFPTNIIGTSNKEKEVIAYIKSIYNGEIQLNSRKVISPYELDIYIPEKKLAIEFDGLYWHSEANNSNSNYHLLKTDLCQAYDIQLIHIFENEWDLKQQIVKARLKHLLDLNDNVIFARKCKVAEISSADSNQFLFENHIQGKVQSTVNLGLMFNSKLVALMTFGKCRFDKKHEWELLRYCCIPNTTIHGGAGKLLKYFERNYLPSSLITYADRRWSQGSLYYKLNFQLSHISKPNYFYIKNGNCESRLKYQKHKLKNILEKYDENLSEVQNMKNNGYSRIFDCGNMVFVKNYTCYE